MNIRLRFLFSASLILLSGIAQGQVFKCVGTDGKTRYQQTPCDASATETKIGTSQAKWELVRTDMEQGTTIKAYLDPDSVRIDGPNRRARSRIETYDAGKSSPFLIGELEYLVDCKARKMTFVSNRVVAPKPFEMKGNGVWGPFPDKDDKPSVFERICDAKL